MALREAASECGLHLQVSCASTGSFGSADGPATLVQLVQPPSGGMLGLSLGSGGAAVLDISSGRPRLLHHQPGAVVDCTAASALQQQLMLAMLAGASAVAGAVEAEGEHTVMLLGALEAGSVVGHLVSCATGSVSGTVTMAVGKLQPQNGTPIGLAAVAISTTAGLEGAR